MDFKGDNLTGRVEVDGNSYENCVFTDVELVYNGGQPPKISNCKFSGLRIEFGGAASDTVKFLAAMYVGGFKQIVEPTLQKIRTGKV